MARQRKPYVSEAVSTLTPREPPMSGAAVVSSAGRDARQKFSNEKTCSVRSCSRRYYLVQLPSLWPKTKHRVLQEARRGMRCRSTAAKRATPAHLDMPQVTIQIKGNVGIAFTALPEFRQGHELIAPHKTEFLDDDIIRHLWHCSRCEARFESFPRFPPTAKRTRRKKPPMPEQSQGKRLAEADATPLPQGKLNAVKAAFRAGVTPARIAREFGIPLSDVRKASRL
jgi:hypothetical protein